jgi:demethylmenaquinone methyltransferase/2-methoxy-6-polyprenyl-1,4-benzoquinol methylase
MIPPRGESANAIRDFFDARAEQWNEIAVHPPERIQKALTILGDIAGASVLDLGSGTGVLIDPLRERVGPEGRVVALDLSPRMIEVSRRSHSGPNLFFEVGDFLSWKSAFRFDLIIAYCCFPHFLDPSAFWKAALMHLSDSGRIFIIHIDGRENINSMHSDGAASISLPLPPIGKLGDMARQYRFYPHFLEDTRDSYLFLAGRASLPAK